MRATSHKSQACGALVLLAAACWMGGVRDAAAQSQFDVLYIGSSQPIYDETGSNVLYGSADSPGCLVQIIDVTQTGQVEPPFNPDGTLNTNVVLVNGDAQTTIGHLTSPDLASPGTFSYATDKIVSGTLLFVRVFNSSNMLEASYYGDSDIFTVSGDADFDAVIASTSNSLSTLDTDGDGLSDRLELYYGSSPTLADSDGDGMSDGEEYHAGTGILDSSSYLIMASLTRVGSDLVVQWKSVAGMKYEVECTDNLDGGEDSFNCVSSVITAYGSTSMATIPNAATNTVSKTYRVVLAEGR